MSSRSIYVEILMNVPMEKIWKYTQSPELHERWDLRFSEINYLPVTNSSELQNFLYKTRIGFGIEIAGKGESKGESTSLDSKSSALRFWSDDKLSLIREGSGYWKYLQAGDSVRFITLYDYKVRFGLMGRCFDKLIFRPIMGWATAWSFDRLRRWLEHAQHPDSTLRQFIGYGLARSTLGFVWIWHGLIPKLIFNHPDELAMFTDAGINSELANLLVSTVGIIEIVFGLVVLCLWRWVAPLWATLIFMIIATIGVAVNSPQYLISAFNPVTLNVQLFTLAVIALILKRDLPTARSCLRKKPESERKSD